GRGAAGPATLTAGDRPRWRRWARSHPLDPRLAEQAVGPHEEDDDEHDVRHHLRSARRYALRVLADEADDGAADDRPGHRVEPAEDHNGKHDQTEAGEAL